MGPKISFTFYCSTLLVSSDLANACMVNCVFVLKHQSAGFRRLMDKFCRLWRYSYSCSILASTSLSLHAHDNSCIRSCDSLAPDWMFMGDAKL